MLALLLEPRCAPFEERQLPLERIGAEIVNQCNLTRETV